MNSQKILPLLKAYKAIVSDLSIRILPANQRLLEEFSTVQKKHEVEVRQKSVNFNIFNYFRPDEPMHSKLLTMLLDPKGDHGQGTLFLHCFLRRIGIEFDEKSDLWYVTAEIDRIDILIRSSSGHVIIIENKSNWAVDQDSQLYRYWYKAIFLPNKSKDSNPLHTLLNTKRFQIIYLVPSDAKIPSDYSLEKNKNIDPLNELGLPEKLDRQQHIQSMTFREDIVHWLIELLPTLEHNHRLREYLLQYIELWKTN
jgi:hypothetical protein